MFKSTLAGHPLHPILVTVPIGLFSFSLAMDLAYVLTRKETYGDSAYHSLVGGLGSSVAAGAAGAVDYFSVPGKTVTKRTANIHVLLNVGLLAVSGLNLFLRRKKQAPPGAAEVALSAIGVAGLLLSSWYGADLVYEHGMRVKGVDPLAQARDLQPPGDQRLTQSLRSLETGPSTMREDGPERKIG